MKNKYYFGVKVLPRDVVLDVQGRAVSQSLIENGFKGLNNIRVGKYFEVEIEADTSETAMLDVKKMTEFVLHNPLVEKVSIERLER